MEREPVDIVLADIEMVVGEPHLLPQMLPEILNDLKIKNPRVEIAVMTPSSAVPKAVQALQHGASEYIVKPFTTEEIRAVIQRMAQTLELKDENRFLREQLQVRDQFGPLVGQSPPMQQVFKMIQKVARTRSPVLILGESGTGKELVAHSIHDLGPWREKPFVPLDCGSLAPTLIESELFGHVRGAFTGANASKQGLLESARDGTLFFDEIGELPIELQTRLLRAIQEKEFRPVGGTQRTPFDARIIAATNRDLKSAVEQGDFRQDLYFRLNVVSIRLPPLRERRADVPLLAERFLQKLAQSEPGHRVKAPWLLSSEALDRLLMHNWPGNVRELENSLERAVTVSSGPLILAKDLPSSLQSPPQSPQYSAPDAAPPSIIPLEDMERQAIERALAATGGDKVRAARLLGIGKTTLYRKLVKYQKSDG
jgi:two-component system response regulator HydG